MMFIAMKVNRMFARPRSPKNLNLFTQRLGIWIVKFFSGGPFRFLMVPILGDAVFAFALVYSVYIQKQQIPVSGACLMGGGFFGYLAIMYWYWNLIRIGKWRKVWRYMMHFFVQNI
jgi:hypothetical protein